MPFIIKDSKELTQKALSIVPRAELEDIRILELHGKVLDPGAADDLQPISDFDTKMGVARNANHLIYRFEHDFTLKGRDDTDAVQVSLHIGALFTFPEEGGSDGEAEEEALAAFGRTTVQMAVYPYLRNAVSDLIIRLGCRAPTMDLLLMV